MVSRCGSCRVPLAVISSFCICKNITVCFASPTSMSNCKFDKLMSQEKVTPIANKASVSNSKEVQTFKYTKTDLLKILKIF